jgi:hypothetical protein
MEKRGGEEPGKRESRDKRNRVVREGKSQG